MSCKNGENCREPIKRTRALLVFGLLMLIFIVLSAFSFIGSRNQVTPDQITFGAYGADAGKRVFQAYNCMGCHTIVGNGAYFAPDLTKEYNEAGPAWLAAFIPSAAGWPTEAAVRTQLMKKEVAAEAGVDSIDAYFAKYPGAKERVERRRGHTLMPNLPITADETGELLAFLKYTSAMNTEGWPPKVMTGDLEQRLALHRGGQVIAAASAAPAPAAVAAAPEAAPDPAARGKALAQEYACTACHATDANNGPAGPGWGGLFGAQVALEDGSSVTADAAYLADSIKQPHAQIVAGYGPTMPDTYGQMLSDDDVNAIVAYIRSLEAK